MARMSDILQVRVTPELAARLKSEADRLGLRPADVVRVTLAKSLAPGLERSDRREPAEGVADAKRQD